MGLCVCLFFVLQLPDVTLGGLHLLDLAGQSWPAPEFNHARPTKRKTTKSRKTRKLIKTVRNLVGNR